ncbi:CBS domain containing protein [Xylanimonas cellulosilytica DSM 15894]|uniref:CBS domain containing protein n=1 Tax=Xylanimonas cellulosilytica (strain DSM 15894 / JCM 12276 / CECT 5975 / KCTC 9989 / LMG 20990 / NBRC 107835 / XIL07) TaxID=446471 RepID=D1BUW5_XYLCX|nr:hemolysin family protein [Xylanimonas cellulosilytica]ACZ31204.1 CBS domain containing protein [Xylanimonas cellulosilytica DSM 15894]
MTGVLVLVALVGLLLAGLLSAGEAAVLRVTRASIADALAEAEHGEGLQAETRADRARAAQALVVDPPATVAAVAVVRVVAELLALGAVALLAERLLHDLWEVLLALAVVGFLAGFVMARLSPRQLGFRRPLRVVLALSGLLTAVRRLTGWATPRVTRDDQSAPTEEELRDLVDRVGESDVIEEDERELLRSVFELGGTLTREVMVPRTDMVTIDAATPLRTAMSLYVRSGFSRVPVVGESVDDLLGVAYLKDVARLLDADPAATARPVSDVARPPVFVPESKPVDDLLREMQQKATHIALVIDEYGGVAGLVTVEDILEELVGELHDEHDRVIEEEPEEIAPGIFRVPARLPVDELGDLFDLRFDDDDVDTAGGLLAKAIGKVPLVGSAADVGELHLEAERIEGRRKQVATILVSLTTPHPAPEPPPVVEPPSVVEPVETTPPASEPDPVETTPEHRDGPDRLDHPGDSTDKDVTS